MGLRLPCSVQMAFKFGGVQPPQCPRAFTMALTGGVMELRYLTGWLSSPDNIGNPAWIMVSATLVASLSSPWLSGSATARGYHRRSRAP